MVSSTMVPLEKADLDGNDAALPTCLNDSWLVISPAPPPLLDWFCELKLKMEEIRPPTVRRTAPPDWVEWTT